MVEACFSAYLNTLISYRQIIKTIPTSVADARTPPYSVYHNKAVIVRRGDIVDKAYVTL